MDRDKDIQRVFETADDSLQGVLGHYLYILAMQSSADKEKVEQLLPTESIPITFAWFRNYNRHDLVQTFMQEPIFEVYQSRLSLVMTVTIFEIALNGFIDKLNEKGFKQQISSRKYYRQCLIWASNQLLSCSIGNQKAIERIPQTLGIIDNARRIRNLIMHNQGVFNEQYEKDTINENNFISEMHPHFKFYKENLAKPVPVLLDRNGFFHFNMAHLEILHLLHNNLQKQFFGCSEGYNYVKEQKRIEWTKVLWGKTKVKIEYNHPPRNE